MLGCDNVYLKTLEIQGFKSFPDKIKLDFGQGITTIVGPNGSGKSNISDAVRWVMGEQRVKMLRGGKMEDIIFAGTETRQALGFAEVSLTLNNDEKILPIDFNEVTVTRRVYRSGESEYYINKSSCRLKDIHQMFMDTGLGKDGYSIIGQGRIDEILSHKSEERRYVFEEAAGITKYKYRKQEAQKKLELTKQNLLRIQDVIAELELQIQPLSEQAEKAKEYLRLRDALKTLEINVALHNIEKLKESLKQIEQDKRIVEAQTTDYQRKLNSIDNKIEKLEQDIKNQDIQIDQLRNQCYEYETLIQNNKNDIVISQNNIQNNQDNIQKLVAEIKLTEEKISSYNRQHQEALGVLKELEIKKEQTSKHIKAYKQQHDQIHETMKSWNAQIDSLENTLIEKMNVVSELKGKLNSVKMLDHNFAERRQSIQRELHKKQSQMQKEADTIDILAKDLQANEKQTKENKSNVLEYIKGQQNFKQQLDEYKEQHSADTSLLQQKSSKKKMLEDMEQEYEGYYKSVKKLLLEWQEGELRHLNIHGPVSQLIDVPTHLTTAIEMALGSSLQHIVVQNEQDAKAAIQFLKAKHLGRATFLPISAIRAKRLNADSQMIKFTGCLGIAAKLVHYDAIYDEIIHRLLGNVVLVDTIDNAIKMAKQYKYAFRIVTLEGDILNPGGAMTGGSIAKTTGFLSRTNKIKELEDEIVGLRQKVELSMQKMRSLQAKMEEASKYVALAQQKLKELETLHIKMHSQMTHVTQTYEALNKDKNALLSENEQLEEQIADISYEMKELLDTMNKLKQEIQEAEQEIREKKTSVGQDSSKREQLSETIMEYKMQQSALEKDIAVYTQNINNVVEEDAKCQQSIQLKKQEKASLQQKSDVLEQKVLEKNKDIDQLQQKVRLIKQGLEQAHENKQEKEQQIKKNHQYSKEIREIHSRLADESRRIENKKMRIDFELESIVHKLWDDYEQTYSTALSYKKEISHFQNAKKEIGEMKEAIKALGSVNVNAIEEYKNVEERYCFLKGQKNDLQEAEQSLIKIIDEMMILMDKQFSEKFAIINRNFNLVFNELFGGGRATLRLADPDNVLESGIEIEVQPPGKKLQNLMLLSGGERAFTAIALLFAILKVRPTPFCILDEIEAALDDGNVYRFAQYLKNFSQQTQFIIVTHRRGTMESSDILYGVAMQEKGVSKLLAIDVNEIAS